MGQIVKKSPKYMGFENLKVCFYTKKLMQRVFTFFDNMILLFMAQIIGFIILKKEDEYGFKKLYKTYNNNKGRKDA